MIEDGKIYDEVWIMLFDAPRKMLIYSIVEEMSFSKLGVNRYYTLVGSRCGASSDRAIRRDNKDIFRTKKELLDSL